MEKDGNTEGTTGNTPAEAAIGLGFCSVDAMLTIDERVALDTDIAQLRQARMPSVADSETQIGEAGSEHMDDKTPGSNLGSLERLEELMSKMQTPEHHTAVDALFAATPEEISRGSATSRPQKDQDLD